MEPTVARIRKNSKPPFEQVSKLNSAPFLEESLFQQVLELERKRAERSGNTSLLVKIEIRHFAEAEKDIIATRIDSLLGSIIRETDIKGWYQTGSVIGVIFTELGESELIEAEGKILKKVREELKQIFDEQQSVVTRISCEYLSPTTPWSRNGHGHLRVEPVSEQFSDSSNLNTVELMKLAVGQTWFLFSADLLFICIAHLLGVWAMLGQGLDYLFSYLPAFIFSILQFVLTLYIFDLYNTERTFKPRQIAFRLLASSFSVFVLCTILFFVIPQWQYSRSVLAMQMMLVPAFLLLWRTVYFRLFQLARAKSPTLIIGADETAQRARRLLNLPVSPFEFKGFVSDELTAKEDHTPEVVGTTGKLAEIIAKLGIRTIVLAIPRSRSTRITRRILEARLLGAEIMDMPQLYQRLTTKLPVQYLEDQWLLFSDGFNLLSKGYVQRIKRILDFIFAALLLCVASPLLVITAIAIRLDSPGPLFYKQQRVGKAARSFRFINLDL